ncbi:MAG: NAD(P)/FAD-dependent oxidoreductase [Nitrospira sp.]|nr:FAD-dependent monooxygenase [Candidatus Manganitrophaceae bacterium]HIL33833.1 FAD-dependent monooxygenase [Candidatus Manganitrophaceae bacterium]
MKKKEWDLVIVGGGPGSMALALSLDQKGYRIAILDRQSSPVSYPRGEIVQPNSLKILETLGLLTELLKDDIHLNKAVHFYQMTGTHLCTVNYQTLPKPYDYSLILLPKTIQKILIERVAASSNIEMFWGARFENLFMERGNVIGAEVTTHEERTLFKAPIIVGGDGVRSRVRDAFHIKYRLHQYKHGYITGIITRPEGFHEDSRYYLGKGKIFGLFPVSKQECYFFYLLPFNKLEEFQKQGIQRFKDDLLSMNDPVRSFLEKPLEGISSWEETSFMPCFRVRCDQWVVDGGVLLGDAAHAMNPHVAQGRNSAMEDGVVLAEILDNCFQKGDFSRKALQPYEMIRRKKIDLLQDLGDEMAWLWNSGWGPLVWARDRIFRTIGRNPNLHAKMLTTISGLEMCPFTLYDRWRALHLF